MGKSPHLMIANISGYAVHVQTCMHIHVHKMRIHEPVGRMYTGRRVCMCTNLNRTQVVINYYTKLV